MKTNTRSNTTGVTYFSINKNIFADKSQYLCILLEEKDVRKKAAQNRQKQNCVPQNNFCRLPHFCVRASVHRSRDRSQVHLLSFDKLFVMPSSDHQREGDDL